MKPTTSTSASHLGKLTLGLALAVFCSGCGLFLGGTTRHDLTQPTASFSSVAAPDKDLNPFAITLTDPEDSREDKSKLLVYYKAPIPIFFPAFKYYSTTPATELLGDAIRMHLERKGFTILDQAGDTKNNPLVVNVSGKLWRFDMSESMPSTVTVMAQIRITDRDGNLLHKETLKSSGPLAVYQDKEQWRRVVRDTTRSHLDEAAIQGAIAILTAQSKVAANTIQSAAASDTPLAITPASLAKFTKATQELLDELEDEGLRLEVTATAAKAQHDAKQQQLNDLMKLQQSLDGVRATLPKN